LSYDGKYPFNNIISFIFYIITNFSLLKLLLSTPIGSQCRLVTCTPPIPDLV